ncbi:hypothetical protein FACS1894219_00100 [Clostridia bacterium]|nr:hypothetical protein FACS1894219_00100 [Clostridia bacterium]
MTNVNLFAFAEQLASSSDSLYTGLRFDKVRLLEFMEVNDWFGIAPVMRDKIPHIIPAESDFIRPSLELWLAAFKQPNYVKLDVLLQHFEAAYPKACKLYRDFTVAEKLENEPSAWKLLDYMFSNFDKEINEYSEPEIEAFIQMLDTKSTLAAARIFADFLRFAKLTKWTYGFSSRGNMAETNTAYSLQDFAVMAYCVFNEEMWDEQELIKKAVDNYQFADLWLFTALHFVCALRGTDMTRLPAPRLPYEPKQVLSEILNGAFPETDAAALTDELTFRLELKSAKPKKTEAYKDVPEVKLYIAESLRIPLGIIIAIALAHHSDVKPGEQFVFAADNRNLYKQFFGSKFNDATGNRTLSIRRCNKSYLQGIEAVASKENVPGAPKGYMLAGLARSHKGGIGKLPEITEIYLKDAKFVGYSPEFIAREMFERGVFSFIPAVLLEIYTGEDFKKLSVHNQTLMVQTVGLSPGEIEDLLAVTESVLLRARETVSTIVSHFEMERHNISAVLQNIAAGNAPSRMNECLCLMTAIGERCQNPSRAGCIGCGYEILTKSAMRLLSREFERLKSQRNIALKSESWRFTKLMEHTVLPAIAEIIACAKTLNPGSDISLLLDILEGRTKYYGRIA